MLMFEVIPAIDILNGKVVRLTQGDYAQVSHYDYTPVDLAKKYQDMGATRIHIVDLDGAKDGRPVNIELVASIRKSVSCALELGGGIRTLDQARHWLEIGINQVVLGSLLVKNLTLALDIIHTFPKKIIAGIDAKGDWVAVEGWVENSGISIANTVKTLEETPIHSIIYTDISKDGTLAGPNLQGLQSLMKLTAFPIIASGGIGCDADIAQVRSLAPHVSGVIVGKALLMGKVSSLTS